MSEVATTQSLKPQEEQRSIQLAPGRRKGREYENQDHCVTAEQGTTIDDVQKPDYWSHVAPELRPYDEIRLRTDDGTFYARLLVLSVGRNWAKVHVLEFHRLTSKDVDMSQAEQFDGYAIKYRGPHCKFSVVRTSDSQVIKEELGSRAEAQAWLADHVKKTG